MERLNCVILAAGKGTRMRSKIPKVAHPIMGRPMMGWATFGIFDRILVPCLLPVLRS